MEQRTALLVGATGLVGGHCLAALLADDHYARVRVLTRRTLARSAAKLEQHLVGFESLTSHADKMAADDVFCCLGTTLKAAGSKERFRRVDHDYVVEVARLAHKAGAKRFVLVSAIGASSSSSNFYLRVKGETEREVQSLGYSSLEVFRPSVLLGERSESRPGERLGATVLGVLSGAMLGPLRQYRPIHAEVVAKAMVAAALRGEPGIHIRTNAELVALARGG